MGRDFHSFLAVATSITGDADSAYDAVQEAFARALKYRRGSRCAGRSRGWLWRTVVNTARACQPRLRLSAGVDVDSGDPGDLCAVHPRAAGAATACRVLALLRRAWITTRSPASWTSSRAIRARQVGGARGASGTPDGGCVHERAGCRNSHRPRAVHSRPQARLVGHRRAGESAIAAPAPGCGGSRWHRGGDRRSRPCAGPSPEAFGRRHSSSSPTPDNYQTRAKRSERITCATYGGRCRRATSWTACGGPLPGAGQTPERRRARRVCPETRGWRSCGTP